MIGFKLRIFLMLFVCSLVFTDTGIAQQRLEYERWGQVGVGKLATKISNTNLIAAGRLKWPELSKFPAFEYPYNPELGGRHIYYGCQVSFHVAGFSMDRGPTWNKDPNSIDEALVESGDQQDYRFYKGFHYDGFPEYSATLSTAPIPVSDDDTGWPENGWPLTYPTSDPVLDMLAPNYPTAYKQGILAPIPLPLDTTYNFPGAGPNRYTIGGLHYPGKVVADQESFTMSFAKCRDNDQDGGHLMIHTSLRCLSWKGDLAEDFLFWVFTVTNIGTLPIDSTYVGIFADFDFPWSSHTEYNTYSKTDCFAFDTYDIDSDTGEELKIAYGWDGDGDVPGAIFGAWPYTKAKLTDETPVENVALTGVIFLETPASDADGKDLGITTFDALAISLKGTPDGIGNTADKFYWLNIANRGLSGFGTDPDDPDGDGIDNWTWEHPFPMGAEIGYSNGEKAAMTVNTGPFTLQPGETDTLICATVMGLSRADLFKNAKIAHTIYASGWVVPKPPFEPELIAEVESGKITLRWGNISENDSLNALVGRQAFEGYKIMRSDDGGVTWGSLAITDENGTIVDYVPAAQYDLINGITGPSPIKPTFNRGADTGMDKISTDNFTVRDIYLKDFGKTFKDTVKYVYVDESVLNGFSYRYAVLAYSAGDETPEGLQPLQSARTSGSNVKGVIPHVQVSSKVEELSLIKVVPNPYVVINPQETAVQERLIKFTHLPAVCTIRLFNSAGELINTIYHDQSSPIGSEESWNLRSNENREVAPGLYFYHISSNLGEIGGKFVIIK